MATGKEQPDKSTGHDGRMWIKLFVLVLFAAAFVAGFIYFRDTLTLENLAAREEALRHWQLDHPFLVYGIAFFVYVVVTGMSLPGAAALSITFGWFFGFLPALILVSFASTTGATLAFLLSRYLIRDTIQRRFGDRLIAINDALEREGPFYLFTLRLIPAVPFFVINVVMGLTPIRVWTFWWVSQLGMIPGTIVYVYAGASVPDLQTLADEGVGSILSWQVILAFVLLGTFPLIVRYLMKLLRPKQVAAVEAVEEK